MANRLVDLTGERFGRLVVIRRDRDSNGAMRWLCRCDCGGETHIDGSSLTRGKVVSCGCRRAEVLSTSGMIHGGTYTPEFSVWKGIIKRCTNPRCKAFKNYGGRGITVCERWRSFANFRDDMGPRPLGMSIERIDNERGYSQDNCRWIPNTEQGLNTRRTVLVTFAGVRMPLSQACACAGLGYNLVRDRIRVLGWPIDKALTQPKQVQHA
jgi:hypothetical protein